MKNKFYKYILFFLLVLTASDIALSSELIVVTSKNNSAVIDESDIKNIFLGKTNTFSNGLKAEPLNIINTHPSFEKFSRKILKKTPSQLRAYWAKRVFTGKGLPPITVSTEEELKEMIKTKKNYITYVTLDRPYKDIRAVLIVD